jgi:hypothetical protein
MSTETIREKLHNFIDTAEDKKVEAIYILVEDDIEEVYDHWKDEEFVNEIDQRIKDFESGKVKGIPWEEVNLKAENRLKTKD